LFREAELKEGAVVDALKCTRTASEIFLLNLLERFA
jgi:hypothetical protein